MPANERGYDWDDGNVEHITRRRNITQEQVESALEDPGAVPVDATAMDEEERFGLIGRASDGTLLVVIYTERGAALRPISARRATPRDTRRYLEKR
jgi:uncharacterized DUF497 family protein